MSSTEPTTLYIRKEDTMQGAYVSNVLEEVLQELTVNAEGYYEVQVRGAEIVTVGLR